MRKCLKCKGAGWVHGRKLDIPANEEPYQYNLTKYTCDWCKGTGEKFECSCGAECWHLTVDDSPCSGTMHVSEDYPGQYTHFCTGHKHPEDT